jgi:hypothetical protein
LSQFVYNGGPSDFSLVYLGLATAAGGLAGLVGAPGTEGAAVASGLIAGLIPAVPHAIIGVAKRNAYVQSFQRPSNQRDLGPTYVGPIGYR